MGLDAFIDRKLLFNALPACSAKTLPRFRIARKNDDGIADRLWVSRRHHQPGLGVDHCLGVPADVGDDHRQSRRHALQNDVGEALLPRGQEAEIRRREQAGTSEYCPRNWMRWLIPHALPQAPQARP